MIERESELKALLTEREYQKLFDKLSKKPNTRKITQINYYYDTCDFSLSAKSETLRVRQIGHDLKLQYKYNRSAADNIHTTDELSMKIGSLPEHILLDGERTANIGFLLTERLCAEFDGCLVCLDKNYYLGIVDFEIEAELNNLIKLPKILIDISFGNSCGGKYTRFVNRSSKEGTVYEL